MSLFNKLRTIQPEEASPRRMPGSGVRHGAPNTTATGVGAVQTGPGPAPRTGRLSNGLKEFLWHLDGIGRGQLLDLGSAWQTTISFFIERNFKVYTEDLLSTWKEFLDADERRAKGLPDDVDRSEMTPTARAERFLKSTLNYPEQTFDAVLAWDLLDYLDAELVSRLVGRINSLVRDGGVVLAIFHTRKPETFHRYRVLDPQNLELISAPCPFVPQRVYQNREISNMFCRFRSSKTFVGRDQLREGLFIK
jgi:hypothetical protein